MPYSLMAEAVGTMYEALAGMEPLTALALPKASSIAPAARVDLIPEPGIVWEILLPDRAVGMRVDGGRLTVLTRDESTSTLGANGNTPVVGNGVMCVATDRYLYAVTAMDAAGQSRSRRGF